MLRNLLLHVSHVYYQHIPVYSDMDVMWPWTSFNLPNGMVILCLNFYGHILDFYINKLVSLIQALYLSTINIPLYCIIILGVLFVSPAMNSGGDGFSGGEGINCFGLSSYLRMYTYLVYWFIAMQSIRQYHDLWPWPHFHGWEWFC